MHYHFTNQLQSIWKKAVEAYQSGNRSPSTYFDEEEIAFLQQSGHTPQEVYDFAEDFVQSGEPDLATFLLIANARRNHFLHHMDGQASVNRVDTGDLPPKTEAIDGIEWLPRIIPKAKAKLRGEMSEDLMYCCGGDRRFLKQHNIHPAEFLYIVEKNMDDDTRVVDWVKQRSLASQAPH